MASSSFQDWATTWPHSHATTHRPTLSPSFPQTSRQTWEYKFGKQPYITKTRWSKVFETYVQVAEICPGFETELFWKPKLFVHAFSPCKLGLVIYLASNIQFGKEYHFDQFCFLVPKFFLTQNFFYQIFFLDPEIFGPKIFEPKMISDLLNWGPNFFRPNILLGQIFLLRFPPPRFLDP